MRSNKVVLICLLALLLTVNSMAQTTNPLQISGGRIVGAVDKEGVTAYLGIPYAKPPVGELRWRPPQPAVPWEGVRKAEHFGASCMQPPVRSFLPWTEEFMNQDPVSEDCLFLNIWTVAKTDEKQPVLVFIHGGGFGGGSGSIVVYNGAKLAKKGAVVVNMNYRLGAFGFLVHPELTKESEHHSSGNYGLLDMIAALQWVKQNIAAFGGDAARVTIFGQSAGAIAVIDLMQSPLAKALFARGIAQSDPRLFIKGPDNVLGSTNLEEREQDGVKFAESMGAHSIAELRAVPAGEFVKGDAFPTPGAKIRMYRGGPVIDGWILTANQPAEEVPLMAGLVAGDVNMADGFAPQPPPTVANFEKYAQTNYGGMADEFLKLYPAKRDDEVPAAKKASREDQARVGLDVWSSTQQKRSSVIYTYFFDRAIPWPAHPEFGAFHTAEVPYIFETNKLLDRPWEPVDFRLADFISSYWVNFAKSGDPNGSGLPNWPAYNAESHTTMELGEHTGAMPEADPARLKFLLEYLKKN